MAKENETETKTESGDVVEAKEEKQPKTSVSPLSIFDTDIEQAFENLLSRRWMRPFGWEFPSVRTSLTANVPKVDVIDRDHEVVVKAELPGVDKNDLDVSLTERSVTIKASTRKEEETEDGEYHRREISRGEFTRTLALPAAVSADTAKADFADGVLTLTLPKTEEVKRHKVEIK